MDREPGRTGLTNFRFVNCSALKNSKIFVNHPMSIAWIYKLSSIWTWRFSLNVNLGAMMYSEYPKYWSSCHIPRNESSIFTVWLPRKTNYFGGLLAEGPAFEKRDQFSWLHNFSKSWLVDWKICLISRPTKICPVPRQEDGAFEGW